MNTESLFVRSWIIILAIIPACWPTLVEIIEARKSSEGLKMCGEFEIALFTETLEFVNDEYLHYGTAWSTILNQYQSFITSETANQARNIRITKQYLGDEDKKRILCQMYLQDDILLYNGFRNLNEDSGSLSYELKQVQLQYFSRATELVKVIRCPVKFRGQATQLYFQEVGYQADVYSYRGYFVFACLSTPENTLQPLELLMYLPVNHSLPGPLDKIGEEADWSDATLWRMQNTPRIRLRGQIREGGIHYFGKDAEQFFISKIYGFMDFRTERWKVERLVSILDRMKNGYEVDRIKMNEVRDDTNFETTCFNHINHNSQLREKHIIFRKDLIGGFINWITKSVKFHETKILNSRDYKFLQCPIEEFQGRHYLYILPVHYLNLDKAPQVFTFLDPEIIAGGADRNEVIPFLLSEVNV